ncbi:hypothetical protein ABZ654_00145 [Streptomyces hygroscopicus]|uniref:hypothetical protein n=1 Tax=Streptomyces hygroscopicus TaxID=1912 RepID=UPI0033FD50E5
MKTVTPDDVIGRVEKGLLIAGRWRPATAGATFAVYDPVTGRTLCEVADATPDDGAGSCAAPTICCWSASRNSPPTVPDRRTQQNRLSERSH